LDVAKFTTLTPLSLLILCKLSFPIVKTIKKKGKAISVTGHEGP
jgi:hypothetical protein